MSTVFEEVCQRNGWDLVGDRAKLPTPGGRSQTLVCQQSTEDGDEILRIHTAVGSASILDEQRMRSALSLNFHMRYGAMAIHDDRLVLTDTFLLKDADHDEVEKSMEYLARTADQQEKLIYRTDEH